MAVQIQPYRKAPILAGTCNTATECRYTAPIATLELATDPKTFLDRIDQRNRAANRSENIKLALVNTYVDLPFIVLYLIAFVLLARASPSRLSK